MATEKYDEKKSSNYGSSYGKRPLWQWLLIYIVVGGLLYVAVYYLFLSGNSSSY